MPPITESLTPEQRVAYNAEAFRLHFGRAPGTVVEIADAADPSAPKDTGKLKSKSKYQPHKHFHSYPLFGISSEGMGGRNLASYLVVTDLSGSATLIDCEVTKNLDGKDLALLKKRLKDPGVIKFTQFASVHVESFQEHFGFECPGWFNLEYLGIKGKEGGKRQTDMVSEVWGEMFEAFAQPSLVMSGESKLDAHGRYAACQRAQLAIDLAAYQLLLLKRTTDPVVWGWTLTTPRPEKVQDLANGRIRVTTSVCQVERPCSLWEGDESIWQSESWYGRQSTVAQTMKRLEEKCAATKKVMLSADAFGSGQLSRALFAYAQEMMALECVAAVESGFFPPRTKDNFEVETRRDGTKMVKYVLNIDPQAWGGDVIQPSRAEASCVMADNTQNRKAGLDKAKEQAKREAILLWCRKYTERLEPVFKDLRVVASSSIRHKLRPPSKREQEKSDKTRRYTKELNALWAVERAFWIELRNVEGLAEQRNKKRTALSPQDNRIMGGLYSSYDLLPNEVAERSWRLAEAPKTVRVKAKSAYTCEKLVAAATALLQAGRSAVLATYLSEIPPQFEEEHKRELLGSDSESDEENKDSERRPENRSPSPIEEAAPVSWAVERDFWLEIFDLPGLGATGNFDLTTSDFDVLTKALAPLLPPGSNPELDLVTLVRLRHDSNAILSARCRTQEMVRDTLTRAKDKEINTTGLKVRLATRQPRQVRLAIREGEAKKFASLMRLKEPMVLIVNDVLERLVCRLTGEPEPPLFPDPESEKEDDEIMEVEEEEKAVEVIDIDLDSDEDTPAQPPLPTPQTLAVDTPQAGGATEASKESPTMQALSDLESLANGEEDAPPATPAQPKPNGEAPPPKKAREEDEIVELSD